MNILVLLYLMKKDYYYYKIIIQYNNINKIVYNVYYKMVMIWKLLNNGYNILNEFYNIFDNLL